jgi:hypothetical protein
MATHVVDHVRSVIRDLDRPLTARERCLILASLRHDSADADVVELLDVARRAVRYRLHSTSTRPAPEVAALLAAVDAVLDEPVDRDPSAILDRMPDQPERRQRADIDA